VGSHIVYYKGEDGGFPQVWAVVSLVNPSCLWFVLAPKMFQLCINHFVLVLCKLMWVSESCQFILGPSRSSSMPLYPSKVLQAKEHASIPYLFVVLCLGLTFESLKELGARQCFYISKRHQERMPFNPKKRNISLKINQNLPFNIWEFKMPRQHTFEPKAFGHFIACNPIPNHLWNLTNSLAQTLS